MLGAIQSFFSIFFIPALDLQGCSSTAPVADPNLPWCNPHLCHWLSFAVPSPWGHAVCCHLLRDLNQPQTICFICGVIFLSCLGFQAQPLRGREAELGGQGCTEEDGQEHSQTCCWEPLVPPGGSALLRVSETVHAFNTWSQLCFQYHQLGHKHCSDTHTTAVSNH